MKYINIFIIVLCGLLCSYLFASTILQQWLILYIPIIYSSFYGYKFFRFLLKSKYLESTTSLVISLLFFLIYIKLEYTYYNSFWILFLIGVTIYIWKSVSLRNDLKHLARPLIVMAAINLLLLCTPNESILGLFNTSEILLWKPNLEWKDLQAKAKTEPIEDSLDFEAVVATTIAYKVNKAFSYPPAIIVAGLDRKLSYRKEEIHTGHLQLLKHEQGHFNIVQRHKEIALDSIAKLWGQKPEVVESTIQYFFRKHELENSLYDKETNHGIDSLKQVDWSKMLKLQ